MCIDGYRETLFKVARITRVFALPIELVLMILGFLTGIRDFLHTHHGMVFKENTN